MSRWQNYLNLSIKNYFKVLVTNHSKHDAFLQKSTILGNLEYISSVVPLRVKSRNLEHSITPIQYEMNTANQIELEDKLQYQNINRLLL